jgi:hypothetical protein
LYPTFLERRPDSCECFFFAESQTCSGGLHRQIQRIPAVPEPEVQGIPESVEIVRISGREPRHGAVGNSFESVSGGGFYSRWGFRCHEISG